MRTRYDHEVGSKRHNVAQFQPKALAYPPFECATLNRVADFARDGHTETRCRIAGHGRVNHKMLSLPSQSSSLCTQKFGPAMEPVGRSELVLAKPGCYPGCFGGIEIASRMRPFARRRRRTLRPPGVAIRARKPWVRTRLRL